MTSDKPFNAIQTYYELFEHDGDNCEFVSHGIAMTKEQANEWVEFKPHRTWHEKRRIIGAS